MNMNMIVFFFVQRDGSDGNFWRQRSIVTPRASARTSKKAVMAAEKSAQISNIADYMRDADKKKVV